MAPPQCEICSFHQPYEEERRAVYHRHFSAREMRLMQGVDYTSVSNRVHLCPTCMNHHPVRPQNGLNVCLGSSQLYDFHHPREPGVECPPDKMHVDWLTIAGGTIADLEYAWSLDYQRSARPMRVLLASGLNDLLKGGTMETLTNSILQLKNTVDENNKYHPEVLNEFVVATLLNPPILAWFPDFGQAPTGHNNRLQELRDINNWIVEFNNSYGNVTPRFHRFGLKTGKYWRNGVMVPYTIHQISQWRQSEPLAEKLHLSDKWRIRLGGAVLNHFEAELNRKGPLLPHNTT